MRTNKVALMALLALGWTAAAQAGVLTFTNRTSFESQGSVTHNYGFEDVALNASGNGAPGNPYSSHGVTYNTGQNAVIGPRSQWEPRSNVFAFAMWSPIKPDIDPGARYSMLGLGLGYVGEFGSPMTFTAFTNLGSHSFTALSLPEAKRGLNFYGFAANGGEYFTGFRISAESDTGGGSAPVIDNVTLGAPQGPGSQVPEPATLLLLGAGLLGLGASRRRGP